MQGTLKSGLNGNDVRVKPKGSRVQIKPAKRRPNCHVTGKRKKKNPQILQNFQDLNLNTNINDVSLKLEHQNACVVNVKLSTDSFVAYITTRLATFKSN